MGEGHGAGRPALRNCLKVDILSRATRELAELAPNDTSASFPVDFIRERFVKASYFT